MKVMQIVGNLQSVGGIETFVHETSQQLMAQSIDVVVVTGVPPLQSVPYAIEHIKNFVGTNNREQRLSGEAEVLAFTTRYRPDVIVSHTTANPHLLRALDNLAPTVEFTHVFFCHGSKLFRHGNRPCKHPVGIRCLFDWYVGPCGLRKSPATAWSSYRISIKHREAVRKLSGSIVLSDYMRDYLIGEGVPAEDVFVAKYFAPKRSPALVAASARVPGRLLLVGRVTYNKGFQYALRAMQHLGSEFTLKVVGDGFYLPKLRALAAELELGDRVQFLGPLVGEALADQRRLADIAVVPSIWPEPAGLVVPESSTQGLKVVAFDVGGLGEWAPRDGYSGVYLAKQVTPQSLAAAIRAATDREAVPLESRKLTPAEPIDVILRKIAGRRSRG